MEDRSGLNPKLLLLSPGFSGSLGEGVVWTGLLGENRFGRRLRKGVREGGPLGLSCDHTGSMQAAAAEYPSGPGSLSESCCMATLASASRQLARFWMEPSTPIRSLTSSAFWVVDQEHNEASPQLSTELGGSGGQTAFTNPDGYSLSPQLPSPKEEGADSGLVTHPGAILPSHPQAWPSPAQLLYYRLMTSLSWRGREGSGFPFPSPAPVCLLHGRSQPCLYGVGLEE